MITLERCRGREIVVAQITRQQMEYVHKRGEERRRKAAGARLHQDPLEPDVDGPNNHDLTEGFLGEFTFAMIAALPAPKAAPGRSDGGRDFVLSDGTTIDVKYTRYRRGSFLPRYDEGLRADIGALMVRWGSIFRVALVGWLTLEEWQASIGQHMRTYREKIGPQPYYPQYRLAHTHELLERIRIAEGRQ